MVAPCERFSADASVVLPLLKTAGVAVTANKVKILTSVYNGAAFITLAHYSSVKLIDADCQIKNLAERWLKSCQMAHRPAMH